MPGPIVLVGLSGSGKTVVGHRLAERLGWLFLDVDAEVERRAGCRIETIFTRQGEQMFRDLEAEVTSSVALPREAVVSTGGGWMARPELRESWSGAVHVWLRVEPAEAAARLGGEPGTRPLLDGPDPLSALEGLLASRLPAYTLAEYTVGTDGLTPEQVVEAVLAALKD
jgi:shikimate kinase